MLGLDVLSAANEGKLVAVVEPARRRQGRRDPGQARHRPPGGGHRHGRAGRATAPLVEMVTAVGGRRVVQMPYGEELPRIC